MLTVNTENSIYEIDEDNRLIRRVSGLSSPTPRQGKDGEWKEYVSIEPFEGGMLICWGTNPNGTAKCTWTSNIVKEK